MFFFGDLVDAFAEGVEPAGLDGDAGGHGVSAVVVEKVVAAAHGLGKVEALDAAGGAFPAVAVAGEDEGGPVEFAHDAGGDNADDAEVPLHVALDDDEIVRGVKPLADALHGLCGDVTLDLPALAVVVVQGVGGLLGLVVVPGQQEVQRHIRVVHSAGGVESGAKVEPDVEHGDGQAMGI